PRGKAKEPDPCIDDGSRCPVVQEVQRQRGEARLPGTCINGEPQRVVGTDFSDRGQWQSGTRCRDADGGNDPRWAASDLGRRQELRHAGICARTSRDEHHSACGTERYEPQERGGSADHTACRGWSESVVATTSRGVVWVDEDGGDAKESEVARER